MKTNIVLFPVIFIITFIGCKNNSTNPDKLTDMYSVSGNVIQGSRPLPNATVSLNKKADLTVQTNSSGEFTIENVPQGSYSLSVEKTYTDGSFITQSSAISVINDIFIQSLLLPKGVQMLSPSEITPNSMHLYWTPTDANDFREYKLYRHISSGLDENTGTLIHISTAISDTQFVDLNINPLTTYYYRVYVMNENGRFGGSNIVNSTTLNKNIINNGSFEELGADSYPAQWEFRSNRDIFEVNSNNQAIDGNNCLIIDADRYVYDLSWGSLQYRVPYTELVPGTQYTLSFWYYEEELAGNSSLFVEFDPEQSSFIWDSITHQQQGIWKKYERTFTAPADITQDYYLRFEIQVNIPYNNEPFKMRLDKVSLIK